MGREPGRARERDVSAFFVAALRGSLHFARRALLPSSNASLCAPQQPEDVVAKKGVTPHSLSVWQLVSIRSYHGREFIDLLTQFFEVCRLGFHLCTSSLHETSPSTLGCSRLTPNESLLHFFAELVCVVSSFRGVAHVSADLVNPCPPAGCSFLSACRSVSARSVVGSFRCSATGFSSQLPCVCMFVCGNLASSSTLVGKPRFGVFVLARVRSFAVSLVSCMRYGRCLLLRKCVH